MFRFSQLRGCRSNYIWNSLPLAIRSSVSTYSFRRQLKSFFSGLPNPPPTPPSSSDSAGLSLTLCTLQIYLLTYLLTCCGAARSRISWTKMLKYFAAAGELVQSMQLWGSIRDASYREKTSLSVQRLLTTVRLRLLEHVHHYRRFVDCYSRPVDSCSGLSLWPSWLMPVPQCTLHTVWLAVGRRWVRLLVAAGLHIKVRINSVHALGLIIGHSLYSGFDGVLYNLWPLVTIKNIGPWLPSKLTSR